MEGQHQTCTVFDGDRSIASGMLAEVAGYAKRAIDRQVSTSVLIFDDANGEVVDVDYRGTIDDVVARLVRESAAEDRAPDREPTEPPAHRRPGRPRLGVVSKEVTLLPRHWAWLRSQRGGASATLRWLVDDARKRNRSCDTIRRSQEAAFRFMSAMAGDRPGYEEASRSLFAGDGDRFASLVSPWPDDIRRYAMKLAQAAFRDERSKHPKTPPPGSVGASEEER